jgi:hypothetical protein
MIPRFISSDHIEIAVAGWLLIGTFAKVAASAATGE